jgi:hypothetical protein
MTLRLLRTTLRSLGLIKEYLEVNLLRGTPLGIPLGGT